MDQVLTDWDWVRVSVMTVEVQKGETGKRLGGRDLEVQLENFILQGFTKDRQTDRDKETDRQTQTHRQTETKRERDRDRETEGQREDRDRERQRQTD